MFRSLAFIAVRQEHHDARRQIPLVFAGADELVDDDLRAVGEIAELGFPQNERFGIVATEAVFESEAARFRERRVVNFAERLLLGEMRERKVIVLGDGVHKYGMTLIEGAALRVLTG